MSDSKYISFFLNAPSSIVQIETIELSHPNLSKTYYIVRNVTNGITVTLETGDAQFFEYYPLSITQDTDQNTLDSSIDVKLGDLGEIVPIEMDNIQNADAFSIKPLLVYRSYRSDDLTAPMFGPLQFEVTAFSFTNQGASFTAAAPALNINGTGEIYTLTRFPMLRGFL